MLREIDQDGDIRSIFDGFTKSVKGEAVLTPEMMDRGLAQVLECLPSGSLVRENLEKAFRAIKEDLFGH